MHEWSYDSENTRKMWNKMCPQDRRLFFCDLHMIDWNEYFKSFVLGMRLYLTEDPEETLEAARIRSKR